MQSTIKCRAPKPAVGSSRLPASAAIIAVLSATLAGSPGFAAESARLEEMLVTADRPALPLNLPATSEGISARQIAESVNTVTSAETVQYLPSVHVRQRYIGDRNAIIAMRANSSISSAQTILYADNLLLSNFLNNSFSTPPRWGIVSPDEIARVDVVYGPFSALYPGNSMGGVVLMTTRMPEKFEMHAAFDTFGEHFKLYGTDRSFTGGHASVSVGNRVGDWSFWLSADRLDNHGHPMTFGNATRKTGAPAGAGTFASVDSSRLFRDIDPTGAARIVVSSLGIDHTVQDNGKLKLAFDINPTLRATWTLGLWQNRSDGSIDSYLRELGSGGGSGRTIYNASAAMANPLKFVRIDGADYTVSPATASRSENEHWLNALSLKSNTGGTWDGELIASVYRQSKEITRTAAPTSGFDSGQGALRPGGTLAVGDGTGWLSVDLRGDWRPEGSTKSAHQWSFGAHYDRYQLLADNYNVTSDWMNGGAGALTSNSRGKSETGAIYVQDAWTFAPDWQLIAGGRWERWRAFEGSNFTATNVAPTPLNVVYAGRSVSALSPKLSLSYAASPEWGLRGAFGKAVRFPTVGEIFQQISLPGNVRTNDPNLRPEEVRSGEFTAERSLATGLWRTSLFWEDKRDALISQTDTTSSPGISISSTQNVGRVRSRGVETAFQVRDLWWRGLDVSASVTYVDSKILRNGQNPAVVGKDQPRIPDWRATLVATWHASDRMTYSAALRYSGRQHVNLLYNDVNPNVYGTAVSSWTVVDAKMLFRIDRQWSASLGVNNLGNYKYYVNPNPYPQRTLFAGVKFDY